MTASELRDKIKDLAKQVMIDRKQASIAAVEYDELTKFPELKDAIVTLLGPQFDVFLASIDWVAPKPTTFRINLKNGQSFYLVYTERTWIAQVEGKKYYLLNLPEEQRAIESIARILRYGAPEVEGGGSEGGDEDISTDIETDTEVETDTEEI
jgi:hypothetical protein